MTESEHDGAACDVAITLAFSVLGKRWNGMIIDALSSGPLSFVALRRTVVGISDAVLSDRVSELGTVGLVTRNVNAGPPVSVSYALSPSGERLVPLLQGLGRWATENLDRLET